MVGKVGAKTYIISIFQTFYLNIHWSNVKKQKQKNKKLTWRAVTWRAVTRRVWGPQFIHFYGNFEANHQPPPCKCFGFTLPWVYLGYHTPIFIFFPVMSTCGKFFRQLLHDSKQRYLFLLWQCWVNILFGSQRMVTSWHISCLLLISTEN